MRWFKTYKEKRNKLKYLFKDFFVYSSFLINECELLEIIYKGYFVEFVYYYIIIKDN